MAAMMLTGSVGITASAEEATASAEVTAAKETEADEGSSEKTTETTSKIDDVSSSEEKEAEDSETRDTAVPDYLNDDFYDTKGNASLIKSERIIYDTEEMQFIAVTTKDGNVFYVLINYSADNGEDQVFFLNKVDTLDLYSLLYMTDDEKENGIDPKRVQKAEEAAMNDEVMGTADETVSESSEAETVTEIRQPKASSNSTYLLLGVIALIGAGAVGFLIMKKKPKNTVPAQEFDEEDYEDIEFDDEEK